MIKFQHGSPDEKNLNASVTFGDAKDPLKCQSERDADGNINITMDVELEPENGEAVRLVLHADNNGVYSGTVHMVNDELVFVNSNINPGY